jgi:exodeoxyribonuclease VII small subunit
MTDETYTFEQTRTRLEEILVAVRKKDTSLEQSLELLEEGVRLANMCNELIDKTSWEVPRPSEDASEGGGAAEDDAEPGSADSASGADADADMHEAEVAADRAEELVPDDERA